MRIVYVLLVGVGIGMIVAGNCLSEPRPKDPAHELIEALKRLPPDHPASAELTRALQSTARQSFDTPPNEAQRLDSERIRTVSALFHGFGSAFLVVGSLGLFLSMYGVFERRLEAQRVASQSAPTSTTSVTP